ncbi:MAG: carbohydrate binding family 9 domain-containing protein [bacterium]|nr:carbohydrate binding family 9 domain-containing protein [bacterium]
MTSPVRFWALAAWVVIGVTGPAHAEEAATKDGFSIGRAAAEIAIDGDLGDPGWRDAEPIETWYETNPGDNVEPQVPSVAYLAYDEKFFYAGFEFEDPSPEKIRAPLGDRDNVPSSTDYGGVILDATNDARTAQMFLANPRGIQYDAISSDASGEDSSPDFYWDAAARVTATGWNLEIRIPFSSLRYTNGDDPQTWRVLLYRNYPRDFRYQMFTSRLPRDVNCFICNSKPLTGLENLPSGSHYVVAPFLTSSQLSEPEGDVGTPLESGDVDVDPGVDIKWIAGPNTVIDATVNPDFSQVESDVAQVSANERFALFFPEKRPFFLEGIDLFATPIQATYTRTFTAPSWGARVTGKRGKSSYTLLVGEDDGGGSVIIPASNSSDLADQDFESFVAIGRWRRDIGRSFLSFLFTDREIDGGAYNRVLGPDFEWRPNDQHVVAGQFLWSESQTPDRPDLADEWDGRDLSGHALEVWYWHDSEKEDWFVLYRDFADDFRADNGFVPQVGYRQGFADLGYTFRPEKGFLRRIRTFFIAEHQEDTEGALLYRQVSPGLGMSGKKDFFGRFRLAFDEVLAGDENFERTQLHYTFDISPSKWFSRFRLQGRVGDEVDFTHARRGEGLQTNLRAVFRPSDRVELELRSSRRTLDVDTGDGRSGRLFTAQVHRLRGVYTFSARSWLRLIGQWVETDRDPTLWDDEVDEESVFFSGSAVFAYKLNWQTVLFLGYGDDREQIEAGDLEPAARQLFLKVSYAFQR